MPTPSRAPVVRPHPRLAVSELPAPGSVSPPESTPSLPSRAPAGPSRERPGRLAPRRRPRKRGRPGGKPLSPAELAARRANLQKAHAAPEEVIYRATARRQAASRANIQKAIAWRRSPGGNAVARLNALKHGAFARTLADTVQRLREDPAEFQRHLRLFRQAYIPQDKKEALLVQRLAETTWRRLRLFHAQARWEADRLHGLFAAAPRSGTLTAIEPRGAPWPWCKCSTIGQSSCARLPNSNPASSASFAPWCASAPGASATSRCSARAGKRPSPNPSSLPAANSWTAWKCFPPTSERRSGRGWSRRGGSSGG